MEKINDNEKIKYNKNDNENEAMRRPELRSRVQSDRIIKTNRLSGKTHYPFHNSTTMEDLAKCSNKSR